MSKDATTYRQCKLRRGNLTETSWIPNSFAKVGRVVIFQQDDGTWDESKDWTVEEVFGQVIDSAAADAQRDNLRRFERVLGK